MAGREALLHEGQTGEAPAPVGVTLVLHVPLGKVHMELRDAFSHEPVAGRSYQLVGASAGALSGSTDGDGRLLHQDLPAGEYRLVLAGVEEQLRALVLDARDPEPLVRYVGGLDGGLGGDE